MFLTMCGRQIKPKNSAWSSTVFCTTERFFGDDVFEIAEKIDVENAYEKIREQVQKLNPSAQDKKITKFIYG